jgi:cell division septation protein DedD
MDGPARSAITYTRSPDAFFQETKERTLMQRVGIQFILMLLVVSLPVDIGAQQRRGKGDEYTIQIAALMSEREARRLLTMKRLQGVEEIDIHREKTDAGTLHRIQIGRFPSKPKAEQAARDMKERGLITEYFITTINKTEIEEETALGETGEEANGAKPTVQPRTVVTPEPIPSPVPATPNQPTEKRNDLTPGLGDEVLKLAAKSVNAAATTAVTMAAFRNNENGYVYLRPRDWSAKDVGSSVLREEGSRSGEMFISAEAGAFISTAYRRFESTPDGYVDGGIAVKDITPENLIERMMGKLRKLPGVSDVNELRYSVRMTEGVERTEVALELKFRPSVNDQPVPFVVRAVLVRNSTGLLELIGFRQNVKTSGVDSLIEQTLSSVKLASTNN